MSNHCDRNRTKAMQSIGLLIKDEQMVLVSLKQGLRATWLEGYETMPLGELKGEDRDEALLYNLERFLRLHPGGRDNLFLALSRDQVLMQAVYLPLAVEENLGSALNYEMDRLTPFSLDAIYFDYYILKRFPARNQLYLMLIVVKKEVVDNYLNLLKKIGVRPRGIELTSTALFNIHTSRPSWRRQALVKKRPAAAKHPPGKAGEGCPAALSAGAARHRRQRGGSGTGA